MYVSCVNTSSTVLPPAGPTSSTPVSSLAERARRIEAGDYDVTFDTARSDEFGDLNRTLAATRDTLRRRFTELTETTNALEASNAAFDVAGFRLHSTVNSWPIGAFPGSILTDRGTDRF